MKTPVLLISSLTLLMTTSSAQQPPARAAFPAKPGQVWQIDVATPNGPLRWKLSFTGFDKDKLPVGTAESQNFKGQTEWNDIGQRSKGFVFTEAPGRFAGSTGVWVCAFPRYVDELYGNSLVGVAAYQVGNGLAGNAQCQATLLADANPVAEVPPAPAFDPKSVLPPRAGQRWRIKLSEAESVRVQFIGFATTTLLEGRLEGNTAVLGGYEYPSSSVPTSLGEFYVRQADKVIAKCKISTDSKLEVSNKTYAITGTLAGGSSACVVSIEAP